MGNNLSVASIFAGLLSSTAAVCSKSYVRINKGYNVPICLFVLNTGMASSNKSCCTDLFISKYR